MNDTLQQLLLAAGTIDDSVIQQLKARHSDEEIRPLLRETLWRNPLAKLSPNLFDEWFSLKQPLDLNDLQFRLLQAQEVSKALAAQTTNIYVAAMPKSGSTFVTHSLSNALNIPFKHLTTSHPMPSRVGMNGREQELDELAVVKTALAGDGFVAQHHTKSTPYLMRLFSCYNVSPIVTFRNIFDGMISLDEMIKKTSWNDPFKQDPLKIPVNYPDLNFGDRMEVISSNYGIWCVDFYLSWRRIEQAGFKFLWVNYDKHLSKSSGNKRELCESLIEHLKPTAEQESKLYDGVLGETLSDKKSRFRNGRSGEGVERVPQEIKQRLLNYATTFNEELEKNDMEIMFGQDYGDIA